MWIPSDSWKYDIVVMVHGDDFVSTADIEDLRWVESMLNENFEITTDIIVHDEKRKKQLKVLNRFASVKCGYTNEPGVRHSVSDTNDKNEELLGQRKIPRRINRIDLSMSRTTKRDWSRLQRFGRFLAGCQRTLTAYSDANWAKNASDRRSTCGGVLIPSPSFTPW